MAASACPMTFRTVSAGATCSASELNVRRPWVVRRRSIPIRFIADLATADPPADHHEKERLLPDADEAVDRLRIVGAWWRRAALASENEIEIVAAATQGEVDAFTAARQ